MDLNKLLKRLGLILSENSSERISMGSKRTKVLSLSEQALCRCVVRICRKFVRETFLGLHLVSQHQWMSRVHDDVVGAVKRRQGLLS